MKLVAVLKRTGHVYRFSWKRCWPLTCRRETSGYSKLANPAGEYEITLSMDLSMHISLKFVCDMWFEIFVFGHET